MTSERQKAANQANARRSTGPQTPEGKAVIRLNALRHGLLAGNVVLPGEDADAFEDLWNQVRADLSPMGPIEELLSERVVNAMWRLRRLARAETALFHWRVHGLRADRLAKQVRSYEETLLDRLSFPTDITDKASHTEATEALGQAEDERDRDEVLLGCGLDADAKEGDAFGKLARYETSLERSLFRTLCELRQVQDERRNRPPSSILDAVALNAGGYLMTSSRQSWAYRRALPQAHPGPSVFYTSVRSVSALIAGPKFSLFLPNKAIYRAISFSAAAALRIRTAGGWARLYAAAVEATLAGVGFAPEITEEILLSARPVGALEITEAGTRFIPFIDPARLAIALALGSLISLAIVADVRV